MKAVTGNRLVDGAVIYLSTDNQWTEDLREAAQFGNDNATAALATAQSRAHEIADVYLIDLDENGAPGGRARIRETIRKSGPSVRVDLGYQASP